MPDSIKAVIFDMDGVLVDACEWHYQALNLALEEKGFTITPEEHLNQYNGLPTQIKLNLLTERKGLAPVLHKEIERCKQRLTMELIEQNCQPVIEHINALSRLRFSGIRLAVASNSIRRTIEMMLTRAGVTPWIEFYLSNEDVMFAKPAPDIYLKAIERLGLKAEETLIVEDSPHGVMAARASGARVMCVNGCEDVNYHNISECIDAFKK